MSRTLRRGYIEVLLRLPGPSARYYGTAWDAGTACTSGTAAFLGTKAVDLTPPAIAIEYAALVARRVHDRATPVRWSFIRGAGSSPPPMTRMLRGGRGGSVRLKLFLAFLWFAANPPHDVTYPARAWAGLLGLDDPESGGARRVTDGIDWLAAHDFVKVSRQRGRPAHVTLLHESGDGSGYQPPYDSVTELQAAGEPSNSSALMREYYAQLPVTFWTNGWAAVLSGRAVAMLLALLAELGDLPPSTELWFSPFVAKERFGLGDDARSAGLRELQSVGLVEVHRRSINKDAFDFRRMRNAYTIELGRLGKRPDG